MWGLIQQAGSRACEKAQRFATAFFPAIFSIPLLSNNVTQASLALRADFCFF
jgi:hypothetical protein